MIRDRGALALVDGAQAVGQMRVDVKDMGCDAYVASPHKWMMAPKGTGLLFIRRDIQSRFWTTLADHSERYRKIRLLHHREAQAEVRDVSSEHAAIMQAVLARDADKACALLDAHLGATQTSVVRLLQIGLDPAKETQA